MQINALKCTFNCFGMSLLGIFNIQQFKPGHYSVLIRKVIMILIKVRKFVGINEYSLCLQNYCLKNW